jgi:hypothetical protein
MTEHTACMPALHSVLCVSGTCWLLNNIIPLLDTALADCMHCLYARSMQLRVVQADAAGSPETLQCLLLLLLTLCTAACMPALCSVLHAACTYQSCRCCISA